MLYTARQRAAITLIARFAAFAFGARCATPRQRALLFIMSMVAATLCFSAAATRCVEGWEASLSAGDIAAIEALLARCRQRGRQDGIARRASFRHATFARYRFIRHTIPVDAARRLIFRYTPRLTPPCRDAAALRHAQKCQRRSTLRYCYDATPPRARVDEITLTAR